MCIFRGEETQKLKSGGGKDLEEFELYLPVDLDLILGLFFTFRGPMGNFLSWGRVQKLFWGSPHYSFLSFVWVMSGPHLAKFWARVGSENFFELYV